MENMVIDPSFWKNRMVFLTGNTGFKGSWLTLWLMQLGATVAGYALVPPTNPAVFYDMRLREASNNNVTGDIRDSGAIRRAMQEAKPDIVIHMAAQSLVRDSYVDPVNTYSTNIMGTINLLEAVRKTPSVKAVLNITSDKCYENQEWIWGYRETEPMGGYDPYSSSKGCAELVSSAYRRSFLMSSEVALATARSGNVIGGGDWARDRVVPDAMRAFMANETLMIRNPTATRPWQHVLEPLSGYLMLCQQLILQPQKYVGAWNFGPKDDDVLPVSSLAEIMVRVWGEAGRWEIDQGNHPHEALSLRLDCSKASSRLRWIPRWGIERALEETVNWYKAWNHHEDMRDFTLRQITKYQQEWSPE